MRCIKCVSWNVQSVRNKCAEVMEHVSDVDASIAFLTETWMEADKSDVTAVIKSYGYKLLHNRRRDREKETGGGVGVLVKSTMTYKHLKCKFFSSFEVTMVRVKLTNSTKLVLVTIYRLQFIASGTFVKEFTELLEIISTMPEEVIISGDINFHLETDNSIVRSLQGLWNSFNLVQHVNLPTQIKGHTLDMVLTRNCELHVSNLLVEDVQLSDHYMISFNVDVEVVKQETKTITYRNLKGVDTAKFSEELVSKLLQDHGISSFGERINSYNSTVKDMVNDYAPLLTKTIKIVPNAPWFDSEYKTARRARRKAEKKFKKSKSSVDREAFVELRKQTTRLAFNKKREYCAKKIEECNGTKALFGCVYELLDQKKPSVLPSHDSKSELASRFNTYFKQKISDIRKNFPPVSSNFTGSSEYDGSLLSVFTPATEDEIRSLIMTHGIKCSPDDPIPAKLLKPLVDTFVPIWTELVNLSLEQGSMECLKCGVLAPLIKDLDSSIDNDILKNYRPVTNLQLVGKLIERVVDDRLDNHMNQNKLHSSKQYAYKVEHSTELLLTKVVDNLLISCDKKTPTLVMFLDLSAAFDTVDQAKLLQILHDDIGVRGVALKWFESFLCGRTQKVKIGDEYSSEVELDFGVTQGSILGPKLFNIYAKPFPEKLKVVKVSVEGYADDHQLLKGFNLIFQVEVLVEGIQETFDVIENWMRENFLKLNSDKTQIMIVAPEAILKDIKINGTFINGKCIRFVNSAKNLGVYFDSTLSMDVQVQKVVSSCFSTIRLLSRIKHFLITEQLQLLVCSLVLSVIDYCNILYYGMSNENLKKLQSVQNSAARLACKVNIYDRVPSEELFRRLHWLKVRERIAYKVLVVVHKCVYGNAPSDVKDLVRFSQSNRTKKLEVRPCLGEMGNRAFSVCGPRLWNCLPTELRMNGNMEDFKKKLKTYLFKDGVKFYEHVHMK